MGNSILSVIIPVFNTKGYLMPLLDKLVYQKETYYPETEIIVVDDGSTEDMSFLDGISEIRVLHKENGGVSSARNAGLRMAVGEFIAFVDSDDDVTDDFLHTIYINMREGHDYCLYNPCYWHTESLIYNWAVWGYSFNREMINGVFFDESFNVAEDIDWLRKIIQPNLKRKEVNKQIYRYNSNNLNSLCHLFNAGKLSVRKET